MSQQSKWSAWQHLNKEVEVESVIITDFDVAITSDILSDESSTDEPVTEEPVVKLDKKPLAKKK